MDELGLLNILMAVGGLLALFYAVRHDQFSKTETISADPLKDADPPQQVRKMPARSRRAVAAVLLLVFASLIASIALTIVVAHDALSPAGQAVSR